MNAPRYFVAVFGALESGKGPVEAGVHSPRPISAPVPSPGDVVLLYCTGNYPRFKWESPGIGVVLSADQERTEYRWVPLAQPIALADIKMNLDPDDATKMGNIRFESHWLFGISQQSFSKVVGNRSAAWGNL